ncbi:NAD(P)H-dependent oxidoreductase subunit E [Rhodospirillaceae bacterium]|nr:NADH-quinone oxidoreductase subunit F [Rhodospirillaceae bacterium]MBT6307040.1 NADH-quinone oxidoreductase subunit F [Rhodospirillaceae bacterium]MBT7731704.1 NADH-quinone oxidoreductase subunit F [Rhodospirillaceae bacterium]MDC1442750.1 NAD(P)H-dependent oxidoreductase subunit E [Rhodospirillaceae bacterium]
MSDISAPSGGKNDSNKGIGDAKFQRGSGQGRRKGRPFLKGRQVKPTALEEVKNVLGRRPRRRELLIEYLHLFQDKFGHLSSAHLAALAHEMKMAMAEVYEVATFYAHFDVIKENDFPPPPITVRVCDSLTCSLFGAEGILEELDKKIGTDVRVVRAPCIGACDKAPVAAIGHNLIENINSEKLEKYATKEKIPHRKINPIKLDPYIESGGYTLLKECLSGSRNRQSFIEELEKSALRGLGGAGFPTARKWNLVRGNKGKKVVAVNGDEGEPGTFKDRLYLESDPHRILEGMLIAAWAVGAEDCYFYLRDEYPEIRKLLEAEISGLETEGLVAHTRIHLRRGAGAYICGEESAMIESIEGKRGYPRHRPPYVAEVGVFNRPTLVNNIETLFWIRDIIQKGPTWYNDQGTIEHPGFRSYSVSGRVRNPGVKLAPAGVTAQELIDDYCGGMSEGHSFHAYLPGGASGGILPANMGNLRLDFGQLEKYGCFVGSHAVVILSDKDSIKDAALNLLRFFEDESCGQCSPCRVGTEKAVALMKKEEWDKPLLTELATTMRDASICGLGQAASNPLTAVLRFFPNEV